MCFPCDFLLNIQIPPVLIRPNGLLYNKDCLHVLNKIPSNSIDLILTDPPYGIGFKGLNGNTIKNDSKAEILPIFNSFTKEAKRILKPGRCCCVFCFSGGKESIFTSWIAIMQKNLEYKSTVVWDKGIIGLGTHYRHGYDFILVAKKKGGKCIWNGGNRVSNIIHMEKDKPQKGDHPTPKPIRLLEHFINLHSNKDEIILDPFAGGGSVLHAVINLKRKFIGIEIEKKYCNKFIKDITKQTETPTN